MESRGDIDREIPRRRLIQGGTKRRLGGRRRRKEVAREKLWYFNCKVPQNRPLPLGYFISAILYEMYSVVPKLPESSDRDSSSTLLTLIELRFTFGYK